MKQKRYSIVLDLIIVITSLTGLILNFSLFRSPIGLLYYTVFSNLICFVFYFMCLIKKISNSFELTKMIIKLKSLVLLSLLCTFIIYNFFMVPMGQVAAYDGHFIVSCFVHIITPLLVITDCLINGKNKMLEYRDLLLFLLVIVIYGMVVITYQHLGGLFPGGTNYPYMNFDIDTYGYLNCAIMNCVIIFIYELLGLIIIFINRRIVKKV